MILFGDSLLGRFGKDLIVNLEANLPNVKVYNCAAGGQNSLDGLEHVDYIAKLKPDYVVICFGSNDAAPWKKQVKINDYKKNMTKIMKAFRGAIIVGFPCPPANEPSDPKGTENFNKILIKYNDIFKQLCSNIGANYINANDVFGELLKNGNDYHMGDGIHLDKLGYKIFIDKLTQIIKSTLESNQTNH
jgi:lysophospholipase L1-like esterase